MRTDSQGTSWWDNVKNWFRNTARRVGNVLKAGAGILRISDVSLVEGITNLSTGYIGIGNLSNITLSGFGFDFDFDNFKLGKENWLDKIKREIRGTRKAIQNFLGNFINRVYERNFLPAWNWLNGDEWYQSLTKNIVITIIAGGASAIFGAAIGSIFGPVGAVGGAIIGFVMGVLIGFIWDMLVQKQNN